MKIISIDQPWASAAVLGGIAALSMPYATAYRGLVAIVAGPLDPRHGKQALDPRAGLGGLAFVDARDQVLGITDIRGCSHISEGCDLPWVRGPWIWTLGRSPHVIAGEPIYCQTGPRLAPLDDADLAGRIARQMVSLAQWCRDRQDDAAGRLTYEQVYGAGRDGWRGD